MLALLCIGNDWAREVSPNANGIMVAILAFF